MEQMRIMCVNEQVRDFIEKYIELNKEIPRFSPSSFLDTRDEKYRATSATLCFFVGQGMYSNKPLISFSFCNIIIIEDVIRFRIKQKEWGN